MASNIQSTSPTNSKGTIILTGANGSMGFWVASNLLRSYPAHYAILTVRDDSSKDENTNKLRKMASAVKFAQFSIEAVDLASLSNVRAFADSVIERIATGKLPPISAVICNAFNWSLTGQKNSPDGFDLCFQVSHLSHFLLVLKLLGSMDKNTGRIVLLGSKAHDSKNTDVFNTLGAALPDNLEELVAPTADKPGEELARGFQRYANAKLVTTMFMHILNRRLLEDPYLKEITAVAVNPGDMPQSRCFTDAPLGVKTVMSGLSAMMPIVKRFMSKVITLEDASKNVVALSMGSEGEGARGYFEYLKPSTSSSESQDERKQAELWASCEKWAKFKPSETTLK